MSTNSDITGDRITNALKGDKQKYRDNWDKVIAREHYLEGVDKVYIKCKGYGEV